MRFPEYAYRQSPGAGDLLGAVSDLNRSLVEAEQRVEASRRAVETSRLFGDLDAQAQEMIRNPDTSVPASVYQERMQTALQQTLADCIKDHPDERYRNLVLAEGTTGVGEEGNKAWTAASTRLVDAMRADTHVQANEAAQRYALTPDPLQRLDLGTRTTDLD